MDTAIFSNPIQLILGAFLLASAIGVISIKKPVHACLCFLLTLISLAAYYLQLSAEFIAVMQVLVYAGAILIIFMFVVVLFQDAYQQITSFPAKSNPILLLLAATAFILGLTFLGSHLLHFSSPLHQIPESFGTVQGLGRTLYIDFFFPFEAVIFLFLIAVVGALYIGKKGI